MLKILVLDCQPVRIGHWVARISRSGRVCHLVHSVDEAGHLLASDSYDLVCLEPDLAPHQVQELTEIAIRGNGACRVVSLPDLSAKAPGDQPDEMGAVAENAASQPPAAPIWKRHGTFTGKGENGLVAQDGQIRWRAFRAARRLQRDGARKEFGHPPPLAQDAGTGDQIAAPPMAAPDATPHRDARTLAEMAFGPSVRERKPATDKDGKPSGNVIHPHAGFGN